MRGTGGLQLPTETIANLVDQFYRRLLVQLRSVPVGLRVDSWLLSSYPEVALQQRQAVDRQLRENLGTLSPEVARLTPPSVFHASVGMNAAFALSWAKRTGEPALAEPYLARGFEDVAAALLGILERIPEEPIEDSTLVETWGDRLELHGWFQINPPQVRR